MHEGIQQFLPFRENSKNNNLDEKRKESEKQRAKEKKKLNIYVYENDDGKKFGFFS